MKNAQKIIIEEVPYTVVEKGTKMKNAVIGGASGGVIFGVGGLIFGGIGIASGGTAFALTPVYLAAMGAATGSITGAALGTSDRMVVKFKNVEHVVPAYPAWSWQTIINLGVLIMLFGLFWPHTKSTQS